MTILSNAFDELVTLAASPMADDASANDVSPSAAAPADDAPVLRAIQGAVDEAHGSGVRVAVCSADLSGWARTHAEKDVFEAAYAWLQPRLRPGDGLHRVGHELVVVVANLGHPGNGERLAERIHAMLAADGDAPLVGLAVFPAHGDDAATLLERARASAQRLGLLHRAPAAADRDAA